MHQLKELFLLDPAVTFLNHGSFGATPRPVFAAYQAWQTRLERQPVHFMVDELPQHLAEARAALGALVNAQADDLVFIPNATFGVNVVARSLDLGPGDEILLTDHEYGACANIWAFLQQKGGFDIVRQSVPLPFEAPETLLDHVWRGVSPRTKAIFVSDITSPTAVHFPVKEICARARDAGILSIIDGAHTVGQIPLDMLALDADFYLSNGHKWLCSPKGSAFLYAGRESQSLIEPLVVGWGWGPERSLTFGSDFLDYQQWLGTNDFSAYLAVPAAIDFQAEHDWAAVRRRCHALLAEAVDRICALTGIPTVYDKTDAFAQMAVAPLPLLADLVAMKRELYGSYGVEVPLIEWNGRHFIRISVQGYNSAGDIDVLLRALKALLPRYAA